MSEWISVNERSPEEMEDVLIWDADEAEGGFCAVAVGWKTNAGDWETETDCTPNVTHWMPLPEPPK